MLFKLSVSKTSEWSPRLEACFSVKVQNMTIMLTTHICYTCCYKPERLVTLMLNDLVPFSWPNSYWKMNGPQRTACLAKGCININWQYQGIGPAQWLHPWQNYMPDKRSTDRLTDNLQFLVWLVHRTFARQWMVLYKQLVWQRCSSLNTKNDLVHPRNKPHMPTDYRHTDKHLRLIMTSIPKTNICVRCRTEQPDIDRQ